MISKCGVVSEYQVVYEYSIKVRHRLYLTVSSLSFSHCSPQSHCKNEKERVRAKAERERQKQAQAQQRERKKQQKAQHQAMLLAHQQLKKQQKAQGQQQQRNAPQGSSSSIPLPPGWTQLRDPMTGRFYYHETATRRSQWDRPRNPQYNGHTVAFPQVPRAQGVNGCHGSAGCTGAPAQKCQFKCCGNCCTGRKGRASASGKCSRHKRGR